MKAAVRFRHRQMRIWHRTTRIPRGARRRWPATAVAAGVDALMSMPARLGCKGLSPREKPRNGCHDARLRPRVPAQAKPSRVAHRAQWRHDALESAMAHLRHCRRCHRWGVRRYQDRGRLLAVDSLLGRTGADGSARRRRRVAMILTSIARSPPGALAQFHRAPHARLFTGCPARAPSAATSPMLP